MLTPEQLAEIEARAETATKTLNAITAVSPFDTAGAYCVLKFDIPALLEHIREIEQKSEQNKKPSPEGE